VPIFTAGDGTKLAYHESGDGPPVVCLPGGPMEASAYLGDLGGLAEHLRLILLDLRGTGESGTPADPASYRCDRLVDDVEALREHLGLTRLELLGHSAGANLAVRYAAAYPERVARLLLITPSTRAVGLEVSVEARRELVRLRAGEPWYGPASAAFEALNSGQQVDFAAIAPLAYGRWDAAAQAHYAEGEALRNDEAAAIFGAEGAFDPPATNAALARLAAPVLVLAGEVDVATPPSVLAELAGLFGNATLVIQPGAGHYPWLDDPAAFTAAITAFRA
jgi:proline iminopeptidase